MSVELVFFPFVNDTLKILFILLHGHLRKEILEGKMRGGTEVGGEGEVRTAVEKGHRRRRPQQSF